MIKSKDIIATPPGATIQEQMECIGMSCEKFASEIGMSEEAAEALLNGDIPLTSEIAMRLETIFGLPSHFWNNLETIYRDKIAQMKMEEQSSFCDSIDFCWRTVPVVAAAHSVA